MEAKDTVMTKPQIKKALWDSGCPTPVGALPWIPEVLLTQAEISFKVGIREVVEFLKAQELELKDKKGRGVWKTNLYDLYGLEAKLKEWGID